MTRAFLALSNMSAVRTQVCMLDSLVEISAQHFGRHFSLGPIKTAQLEILGFTVPSQAFSAFF